MNRLYTTFLMFVLFSSLHSSGQHNWTSLDPLSSAATFEDIFFFDENNGWAVGANGMIIHTENGGLTWTQQTYPGTAGLNDVWFTTDQKGYIVGNDELYLRTFDGGNTWSIATPPLGSSSHLYELFFTDEQHGWICGFWHSFRTTDGGDTWSIVNAASGSNHNVFFLDADHGWITGVSGYLGHTNDGGVTWTQVTCPIEPYCVYAHSADEVTVTNSLGEIYQTNDAGSIWIQRVTPSGNFISGLSFAPANPNVGVAVGATGLLLETVDGGKTWSNNSSVGSANLRSVDMITGSLGFICGYTELIFKSEFQDNDLYVFEYQGLDTICANVPTDVIITFYNAGSGPLELVDFVLADETGPIHYYQWTGLIQGGEYKDINLGQVAVNHSGYYSLAFAGDSIDVNNTSSKYIHVLSDLAEVSGPHTICSGDSVEISVTGSNSYLWLFETTDSLDESQIVKPALSTTYFVQVKSNYCVGLDSVNVIVDPCTEPVTAFSPNGDGVNDVLILDNLNGQENSLKIYNRWGDLINSFTNYNNTTVFWDGTGSNGESLKEGTYYYIFETADNSVVLSSWVQIVR